MAKRFLRRLAAFLFAQALLFSAALAQDAAPQANYRAIAQSAVTIRETPSMDAPAVGYYSAGDRVLITAYEPAWLAVVKGDITGWIPRQTVDEHETLGEDCLAFGAIPGEYVAQVGSQTMLRSAPDESSDALMVLPEGARLALKEIKDGWGTVVYWRQYGYVRLDEHIASMEPVFSAEDAEPGDLIAAYCSFYALSGTLVPSRIHNITLCCSIISVELAPGETFDFNEIAGPYGPGKGYEKALSFFEGETVPGYGGGTCQVSSTLYNTLLPLSRSGISILYRRAHGPSGATYLPHGVDAAVGSDSLNLVFRNDFDFPVRIDAHSDGEGIVYIALIKAS
ncbi:MAG TPA: VanW family protein [Candidatus Aphodomonas merdavium]|nr:VanW family protein [Candidatus Aphodomonas merdavium]